MLHFLLHCRAIGVLWLPRVCLPGTCWGREVGWWSVYFTGVRSKEDVLKRLFHRRLVAPEPNLEDKILGFELFLEVGSEFTGFGRGRVYFA